MFLARQHPHQRRLADAVRADQRDAVAALDVQVQVVEDHDIAVGLAAVLDLEHRPAALAAGGKIEMDLLALERHFDRHHLLEHLDPALDLRRLGRLVAEAIDEHLDARDFLVLLALGFPHLLDARLVRDQVGAVVADVVGERAKRQIGDARDHGVEEETIVRDENDGVRIGVQVLFEPVPRLEIEMVGRLVEQQQVGRAQQQFGQRQTHLPAAGERFGLSLVVGRLEAEALQHRRRFQLDAVAVAEPKPFLKIAVAAEHRVVFGLGNRRVAEPLLERVHLGLDGAAAPRRRWTPRRRRSGLRARARPAADNRPSAPTV